MNVFQSKALNYFVDKLFYIEDIMKRLYGILLVGLFFVLPIFILNGCSNRNYSPREYEMERRVAEKRKLSMAYERATSAEKERKYKRNKETRSSLVPPDSGARSLPLLGRIPFMGNLFKKNEGRGLEVETNDGEKIKGRLLQVDEETIVLKTIDSDRIMSFNEINQSKIEVSFK